MSAQPVPFFTPEAYLDMERTSPFKSEYACGQIWAMSGVSRAHDRIAFNLIVAVGNALRGKPCQGFTSDMRVVTDTPSFSYPDLTIVCGEPQFTDAHVDTLTNPIVLVEILSPSTAQYDRAGKFGQYRRLPSLREYVLVHQDTGRVERFERHTDYNEDNWSASEYNGLNAVLELVSVGVSVPLRDLYDGVAFPVP